jgi:predicted phage baseplate assembly protein
MKTTGSARSCGCCEGTQRLTPMPTTNRPGLEALAYRVATHASFLETMKARLSTLCLGNEDECRGDQGLRPLQRLTMRAGDDPAVAFLDAWATLADVLTFYQERLANEGYLRTATERRSILELARLVGYRLRPGVAASVFLAFELEQGYQVEIPAGTRAQSLPAPGELPQPFETSEPLHARAEWNSIKSRLSQLQVMGKATHTVYLKGTSVDLEPNDPLLVIDASTGNELIPYFRQVHEIEPDADNERTKVSLRGDVDLARLQEFIFEAPPTQEVPDGSPKGSDEIASQIPLMVRYALYHLLFYLRNPDLSAVTLRRYIDAQEPHLEQARRVFDSLGLTALRDWVDDISTELDTISVELELRRAALSSPGRLFPGRFINPGKIPKILDHLETEPGESTELAEEIPASEPAGYMALDNGNDTPEPEPVEPSEICKEELKKLKTDIDALLDTLRDSTKEEDEKILSIYAQIWGYHRLMQLQKICGWLECQQYPEWIQELWHLLLQAITDVPSAPDLPKLITPLLELPSRPPANAWRLERTVDEVFERGADVAPRILTTLQRQLKDTLYQAWSKAEVTPLSPWQGVEVLRVKAAPFGAKAPPKTIYNGGGAITGYKEWLLFGISIHLVFDQSTADSSRYSPPVQARIALSRGIETLQEEVTLDTKQKSASLSVYDIPITLSLTTNGDSGGAFEKIVIQAPVMRPIQISGVTNHDRVLQVTIDDYSQTLAVNETRVDTINESQVKIAHSRLYQSGRYRGHFDIYDLPIPLPSDQRNVLTLDAEYDQILPGSWVVIEWPEGERPRLEDGSTDPIDENPDRLVRRVEKVETVSKANFGSVTELTLDSEWLRESDRSLSVLRSATIYCQSEALELAEEPVEIDVQGSVIRLDGLYGSLEPGRWLIISGERSDIPGTSGLRASELAMLAGVRHTIQQIEVDGEMVDLHGDRIHTTLQLARKLGYSYKRDTVKIYGNVVKATHGETRQEVLGSGDGSQVMQAFVLKQSPLTYLAAATPAGAQSTLETRVNDIRWHETDNLIWLGANDRGYITHTDNEDRTTVVFGDGQRGARLPTGIENIKAIYRTGIGKAGNVAAEQISLLATRPLGVKGVINPLAASGGADRERRDQARRNARLAVMALDRLVSLPDYTDFARTYAGIDKASAIRLSDGRQELIHLTIAGTDDIPIDENSDLYRGLRQALHRFGATRQAIRIATRELMLLVISAKVRLLPDYQWESVAPQVRATLLETFSFERRDLGQDVLLSEVLSTIQRVPGVAYVDVDILDNVTEGTPPAELDKLAGELGLKERIVVEMGRVQTYHVVERKIETLSSIAARYEMDEIDLWELNQDIQDLDNLPVGKRLAIPSRIGPAQLAYLSPEVPDTLILTELI